ncbi:MAG: class B sortase [Clostridiales bacterium]|nr:class B sortase [Clostridiales bacterium]MDD7016516.1 class B sortase [Bacillota bacterium]MDY4960071.1 class B sortase [Lentihominibacter sp.]
MGLVRKIILVVCLIVFVGAAGVLIQYYYNGYKEMNSLKDLKQSEELEDLKTDKGIIIGKYVPIWQKNNDLIGWIRIDGTKIDFPVMQTPDDPEYYLRRDFNREHSTGGVPFMDVHSDIFMPTSNFMIYGHNMKNGSMFHDLIKYEDEEFYRDHKTINFDTIYKGGQGVYQVVAAGYSQIYDKDSSKFKYYAYAGMTSEREYHEFVDGVKKLSCYDTGVVPEYGSQLITLSTCTNVSDEGRFFVVAVRTDK